MVMNEIDHIHRIEVFVDKWSNGQKVDFKNDLASVLEHIFKCVGYEICESLRDPLCEKKP